MEKVCAIISLVAALILSFVALFLPPRGVIDSSACMLIAQLLIYSASIMGVRLCILDFLKAKK